MSVARPPGHSKLMGRAGAWRAKPSEVPGEKTGGGFGEGLAGNLGENGKTLAVVFFLFS